MKLRTITLLITAVLLSSGLTIVALRWDLVPGLSGRDAARPAFASTPSGQAPISDDEQTNIRVYDQVSPGVVNITTTVVEYDFFFRPYASGSEAGSGCVLDAEGHVLTNYHVIQSADALEVSLPDRSKYHAKVVGIDKQNDLAIIRLVDAPKSRLHPIPLGNSEVLKVGQKVLAIGNPLGLHNTLTTGIVSSANRRIRNNDGDLVEVIQTDAAINPGNSGGPLLNAAGEMIGVNSSIFTIGGGSIGIGFAIPVTTVRRVATELIRDGRVLRPWFGVEGYSIDDTLASQLELPVDKGVLVARVQRGSSADKAGIRGATQIARVHNERILIGGDIITEFDGKPVESREELFLFLEKRHPGETVQVTLYRGSSKIKTAVNLVEAPRQRAMTF